MTRRVTRKRYPKGPAGVLMQYGEEPKARIMHSPGYGSTTQAAWMIAALQ